MKLVDKYLLKEHMITVAYCLAAFTMMFVVADLFGHLSKFLQAKTPLHLVIRYYLFFVPSIVEYLLPASLMLATLYTLWQLTRNNELTALQASGVNLYRIILPFIGAGLFFAVISAVVKETIAPKTTSWAEDFADNTFQNTDNKISRNQAYYDNRSHRMWLIGEFDMHNPSAFKNIKITQEREDGSRMKQFISKKAEWLDGQWWLHDPEVQDFDAQDNPIGKQRPMVAQTNIIKEMPFLAENPSEFINEVKMQNPSIMSAWEIYQYIRSHPGLSRTVVREKKVYLHQRFAMPWACVIVCLFAIPTGAIRSRRTAFAGPFVAIGLMFAFYALIQAGTFLAQRQVISAWLGAWLSNIVFLVTGIWMLRRMNR